MLTTIPDLDRTEVVSRRSHRAARQPGDRLLNALAVLIPMTACALVSLGGASERQLRGDEFATWWASRLSWSQLWNLASHMDTVQYPYYVIEHLWVDAFGDSPLSLRGPSAIAMAWATLNTYLLGKRIYSRWAGSVAALLLCCVPYVGLYAQTARPYAPAIAFATASMLALLRCLDRPRSALRWTVYTVLLVLLGLMHLAAMMVLAAHLACVFLHGRETRSTVWTVLPWAITASVAVATLAPVIVRGHSQQFQIGTGDDDVNVATFLIVWAFWSKIAAVVVVWCGVVGACLVRARLPHRVGLVVWGVLPYAIVIPLMPIINLAALRYLLFAIPPWTIVAAALIVQAVRSSIRQLQIAGVVFLGLAVLAPQPGNMDVRQNHFADFPDFRAVADYIGTSTRPGDALVYGTRRKWEPLAMAYLMRDRIPHEALTEVRAQDRGWYMPQNCAYPTKCLAGTDRIWLLVAWGGADDPEPQQVLPGAMQQIERDALSRNFDVGPERRFYHARVVLLVRKA